MHNILLVEDNLNNIRLIEQLLEEINEHIHLVKARTGTEAMQKAVQEAYDLVLMDISLPDMDGITAMKELRKMSEFKQVPIIAATAHAMTDDKELFGEIFDDYIIKPIDEDIFAETVKKWLGEE